MASRSRIILLTIGALIFMTILTSSYPSFGSFVDSTRFPYVSIEAIGMILIVLIIGFFESKLRKDNEKIDPP